MLAQSLLTYTLDILACSFETGPATVGFDTSEGLKENSR